MKCNDLADWLDDYLDGGLDGSREEAVREHLATCSACRMEEEDLRRLLAEARSLPRTLAPARDLWPGVEARLPRRRGLLRLAGTGIVQLRPLTLAAAAVLLVAATAAVTLVLTRRGEGPRSARAPAGELSPAAEITLAAVERAEANYQEATARLMVAFDQRRAALSPEAAAVVDHNLAVMDEALAEIHEAIRKEPDNAGLVQLLAATHRKKIEVLQRVVRHSAGLEGRTS